MSINNVTLVGRITKDLELKYTPGGMAICKFILAVNRQFKKEGQPDADFIPVTVFNKQAENLANYMGKGSMIGVVGNIQTGSYEKDGVRVYTTDVIAQSVQFLDSKKEQPQGGTTIQQQYQQPMQQQFQQQQQFTQQPQYQQMSTTHLTPMNQQQGQQFAQQMGAQVVDDQLPF